MQEALFYVIVYLAAAVVAVPISRWLGLGSVLGYLAAGIAIGPVFGLVGSEAEDLRHYAEYGVVLMLFLIGLEIHPKTLWGMRSRLVGLGGLQVGLTLAIIAGAALAVGAPWNQAVALGMVLCFSSTAIVMQTLSEKKLERTEGGRASFAVLLFQDIAVVPLLALLPLLAPWGAPAGGEEEALFADITGWMKALFVVGAVLAVVVAGRYFTHPLFRFIRLARLSEIELAAALLFVLAVSYTMTALGLSPALGTFLAGVVLATSAYRHQIEADIAPFKGLLLGLFFITVGAGINLDVIAEQPARIIGLALAMMAAKAAVLYPLAVLFQLRGRDRLLFTLALAQAGEFGFFLLAFAEQTRVLPPDQASEVLMVISLSMLLTPALFLFYGWLGPRFARHPPAGAETIDASGTVIIAGMGRFGQVVNRMLKGLGHSTVVLDSEPDVIERMRSFGIKGFYGELHGPGLLEAAGIHTAKAIVLGFDDPETVVRMAAQIRQAYPEVKVIARAYDRHHVYRLHAAGVDASVREMFDTAVRAGRYALAALDYSEEEIDRVTRAFVAHDQAMLEELAELWDPEVPPQRNAAYVAKAREQNETIEAELRGRLER